MPSVKPPRWVFGVVATALVVAAVDVAVLVVTRDDTPAARAESRPRGDELVVVDPAKLHVVDRVAVGHLPTAVVTGFGAVWILNRGDGTLSHVDARSHRLVATLAPDAIASDLTIDHHGVWIAGPPRGAVRPPLEVADLERVDPRTGAVDRKFETTTGASALAAGGGSLWSTGYLGRGVRGAARSDALTGAMSKVDIEIYGDLVAADDEAVYWIASIGSRVARVSTRTGRLTASMTLATDASLAAGNVPPNPTDAAVGGGALWISTTGGTVYRIDPRLHGIVASIPVCHNALAVTYGLGSVWVGCGEGTVVRVDPSRDAAAERITVDGLPRAIAAGEGAVWVAVS